jgi:hypothetical protein
VEVADVKKLLLKLMLDAIETKVVELVDLLNHPAGEYAPRARRILHELVDMVLRWLDEWEKDDEPTNPRIVVQHVFSAAKPPPIPRKRQETMDIDLRDLEFIDTKGRT